jgi:uncharacterized protein (DUF1330 family)
MNSFVIVDLTPLDTEKLAQYSVLAAETLKPFKGEFIAKGIIKTLAGKSSHSIKAIIQFPDKESAKNWYASDAYQKIIPLRDQGMDSQFHLV